MSSSCPQRGIQIHEQGKSQDVLHAGVSHLGAMPEVQQVANLL